MRKVSVADLLAIQQNGGKVEREVVPPEIKTPELVAVLQQMVDAKAHATSATMQHTQALAQKEEADCQRHCELMKAMESQANMIAALVNKPPVDRVFHVERDTNGQMSTVTGKVKAKH